MFGTTSNENKANTLILNKDERRIIKAKKLIQFTKLRRRKVNWFQRKANRKLMTLRNDESINLFVLNADCAHVSLFLFHYLLHVIQTMLMNAYNPINKWKLTLLRWMLSMRDSTSRSLKQSFIHLIDLSRTSSALTKNNKQINTWCLSVLNSKVDTLTDFAHC